MDTLSCNSHANHVEYSGCVDGAGTVMIRSALTARLLSPFADEDFVRR